MARQKLPDPPADDVPAWVMTFSDVITLLMTFFILLLTFATNQPETFDRMQVAMFGGGGAVGFAGTADGMDKDDLQMRERSRAGRIAPDGSEMPPIYSDPALATLDRGISGLEPDEHRILATTHHVQQPLDVLVDAQGDLTQRGKLQLGLLGRQMRKRPLQLEFIVSDPDELSSVLKLVEHLMGHERIPSANVGVGVAAHRVSENQVLMVIANQGIDRGSKN